MHTLTLNPTAVTLQPGQSASVVGTISNVPADATANDVLEALVGGVSVTANLTVTVDNPEPVVTAVSNSGATYAIASPVQDTTDSTLWTVDITVTA